MDILAFLGGANSSLFRKGDGGWCSSDERLGLFGLVGSIGLSRAPPRRSGFLGILNLAEEGVCTRSDIALGELANVPDLGDKLEMAN